MTDEALPIVMIKGQDADAFQGLTTAVGAMLGAATARAAEAMILSQLVAEDLLLHLHVKLHECFKAQNRSQHFIGKLGNVLMGGDPDYIEMRGSHLGQVLRLLGTDPGEVLDVRKTYLLRADVARQAHDILGAQLGVAQDTLRKGLE